jgi:Protein of unknown function (DUF4236)
MRGAHLTMGPRGVRRTIGIPGTGIYYTSQAGYHSGAHSAHVETPIGPEQQQRAHSVGSLLALGKLCTGGCAERLAESGHDNRVQRMEVE